MAPANSRQEPYRFLEDRFACAEACADCARACALGASAIRPDGDEERERARRQAVMCAEVCDATCRVLAECQDESDIRVQLEWCRSVCLECARVLDGRPDAEATAAACLACARACGDFIETLR
ncbi:ferredoxin [Streptomyces sp. NPDC058964]|uniref:ferredoxin n=1 Tax=Streptomyces sp. NPDC058964 TaxID=3346681 RepID=UPI0036B2309F